MTGCEEANTRFDLSEVEVGDVVFRRGDGLVSRAVSMADGGGVFSHVGVVVEGPEAVPGVVHVEPGAPVKFETLEAFFAGAEHGAVMRSRERVEVGWVLEWLGREFDHGYDLSDSSRLYCTELVWRVFLRGGVDLSGGRRSSVFGVEYILPSDLMPGLDIINQY